MATLQEIFGGNDAQTPAPAKGTQEWHEQSQAGGGGNDGGSTPKSTHTPVSPTPAPPKGTQEWHEQNSAELSTSTEPNTQAKQAEPEAENLSYTEMWSKLNPYEAPTPEQLEKERKKKKRDQIWSAVGDGISALSNLFFTTQGAPNMYTGQHTLSEAAENRWNKVEEDRKENAMNYFNGYIKAKMADDANARDKRNWEYRLGRDKVADALAAAKEKRDAEMAKLNADLAGHRIDAAKADARRKKVEADYADALEQAKVDTEKARGEAQRAGASASKARAGYYNRGGSGGNSKKPSLTINGETHYYDTEEDYVRAVMYYANEYGIDTFEDVETTEENFSGVGDTPIGKTKKTSRSGRDVSKIAADVETAARTKKKSPTSSGNGKKKSPTA